MFAPKVTSHPKAVNSRSATAERRAFCWRTMDAQVNPGRYILGEDLTLDLYVAVISHWGPGRPRFYQEAPKMAEAVRRLDQDPRLIEFWAERLR